LSLQPAIYDHILETLKGGKGSGYFGHAGRPGLQGGSAAVSGSVSMGQGKDVFSDWRSIVNYFAPGIDRSASMKGITNERFREINKITMDSVRRFLDENGLIDYNDASSKISLAANEYVKQFGGNDDIYFTEGMEVLARVRRNLETEHGFRIKREISRGNITPEEAMKLNNDVVSEADQAGEYKSENYVWKIIPKDTWHATTNAAAVIQSGLASRYERGDVGGAGLGGGDSQTISLTNDMEYAKTIERALHEMNLVVSGKITTRDIFDFAKQGAGGVGHDFSQTVYETARGLVGGKNIQELIDRDEGKLLHYADFFPGTKGNPYTQEEIMWGRTSVLRAFQSARGQEGGIENPFFGFQDTEAFARLDPRQFKVIRFKPKKETAKGMYVWAEREYRIVGGDAVKFAEEIDFFQPDDINAIFGVNQ
jgi:hypothetical protein